MLFDRTDYICQPSPIANELNGLFREKEELIIFEIGACEGEDSIRYSRLFPNSKIYTFEPLPANIELIKGNIEKYNVKNVAYFNKALSSANGTATFYVSNGRPKDAPESDWDYGNKSSSLLPPGKHIDLVDFIEFNEKLEVETITLESFCNEQGITLIDFIHMDVQGAELMVLEGAKSMLYSIKAIWLEVSKVELYKGQPLANEIELFMKNNNFALAKNSIQGHAGDQLYVSEKFFPNWKKLLPASDMSLLSRVLRKIRAKS